MARVQDQLAAVNEALAQERTDDALGLLGALRAEHPRNPDWQALALRVHVDQGRRDMAAGRAAMVEHEFEVAAETFERGLAAFTTVAELFPGHPTAAAEQGEAAALREAALYAAQATRDRAAMRWEAARQGWQAARDQLAGAAAVRGRDFGEVVAVLDAMLGEVQAALSGLDQARLLLSDGRRALEGRDAGAARDAFRAGLARVEGAPWGDAGEVADLREGLAAGLREAERVQRDVKKLLSQAEAAKSSARPDERLTLLRRAHEQWETAPGLAARLADELLGAANERTAAGDEAGALALCRQVQELAGAPAGAPSGALSATRDMIAAILARQQAKGALAEAAARIESAGSTFPPSADDFTAALAVLDAAAPALADAKDLAGEFEALRERAAAGRDNSLAAQPLLARSDELAAAGDWQAAAEALAGAQARLGPLAGPDPADHLARLLDRAAAVEEALGPVLAAVQRAEAASALAADDDLAAVDWSGVDRDLAVVRKALRAAPDLPPPLPGSWHETRMRAERVTRRVQVLRGVHEQTTAGRAVDALPLLQAEAAANGDPVILAVLARLLEQTAADASTAARGRAAQAAAALTRGEPGTSEAYLGVAQTYLAAAPQVGPEIIRVQRQLAALGRVRAATTQGHDHAAGGDAAAALACYRRALELAADGETGLPAGARAALHRLLDLEDDLAPGVEAGNSPERGTRARAGAARRRTCRPAGCRVCRARPRTLVAPGATGRGRGLRGRANRAGPGRGRDDRSCRAAGPGAAEQGRARVVCGRGGAGPRGAAGPRTPGTRARPPARRVGHVRPGARRNRGRGSRGRGTRGRGTRGRGSRSAGGRHDRAAAPSCSACATWAAASRRCSSRSASGR